MGRAPRRPLAARLAAVLTAVALLATGCTFDRRDRAEPRGAASAGTVQWRDCADEARAVFRQAPRSVTYECATIAVPRDWAQPSGETFDIALLRARAAGQRDRIGSLVVNPGGPGGSGVQLAVYLSAGLPAEITRRFDIVGFDPRGVGRSSPIKCLSDADLDRMFGYEPDPVTDAQFEGAVAIARQAGEACAAKYGETLRLFSTEQAARDLEAVRAAVGDEKLTYLGYSYGTLLGATYAQLFPGAIRALVLDGAVDPRLDAIAASEGQAKGFERAFDAFATWCRTSAGLCPVGPDARATVAAVLDRARRAPVPGDDGRAATAGWVFTAIVASLYDQQRWSQLAGAIDDLRDGDPAGIFRLADMYAERDDSGRYSNLFDANTVINCADSDVKLTVEQVRDLQAQWRERYPLFGGPLATSLLTCGLWPGQRDPYPTGPANGAPPILVVGTTGDPATPYEQTPRLAEMLGVGVVLTWEGEGHTAYPHTRCITEVVNAYLVDLKTPAHGHTCPAR